MTKLQAVIQQARALPAVEQQQLVSWLLNQIHQTHRDDEHQVGERGLATWTESTQHEDWSAYYPNNLRNGGAGQT